ncbi:hypothetical protein [Mechercharimyces sp. CAU 1602]|uniref:hypothetical protein n=1 Tax=Mechercharimyces sp. CAU 1602 TaxID=2973933 RepID=UPI0021621855|nr:hypothetical protein [Mechercharimyces sp. CAU 1602]MCS1352142.1 hypothetical protein [Mechercharimyces sp. CAU 1602]
MSDSVIREEATSYTILLYRKSPTTRYIEMGLFLVGFFVLLSFFEVRSTPFIIALLMVAAVIMFGFPVLYRVVVHPRYALYADRLEVRVGRKTSVYPLLDLERTYDLGHIFRSKLHNKKIYLLVSDDFLTALRSQLKKVNG